MNTSRIEVHDIHGSFTAHYFVTWDTKTMRTVEDANGKALRFPTWDKAAVAAYRARDAAEDERYKHWRGVPQIKPCPKVWEARSAAGRKRWAEDQIKRMMKESAA